MGIYEEVMEHHRRWRQGFNKPMRLGVNKRLVVITCMDSRLLPEEFLGLGIGDAEIIRNGGGRVTADVLRSLLVTQNILECNTILVIHHNDCGAQARLPLRTVRPLGWIKAAITQHDHVMSVLNRQMRQNAPLLLQIIFFMGWYLSYLVPGFLRRGITASTLRLIQPNQQGLEASVVTDVKILRKAPMVDPHVKIYGLTYDVNSGELTEVYRDEGRPAGSAKAAKKGGGSKASDLLKEQ